MKSAAWFAGAFGLAASLLVSPHSEAQTGTAPVLKAETIWSKGTGTMHHADELRFAPPFQNGRFPARVAGLSVSAGGFARMTGGR